MKFVCSQCGVDLEVGRIEHFGTNVTIFFDPCRCIGESDTDDCFGPDVCPDVQKWKTKYTTTIAELKGILSDLSKLQK